MLFWRIQGYVVPSFNGSEERKHVVHRVAAANVNTPPGIRYGRLVASILDQFPEDRRSIFSNANYAGDLGNRYVRDLIDNLLMVYKISIILSTEP